MDMQPTVGEAIALLQTTAAELEQELAAGNAHESPDTPQVRRPATLDNHCTVGAFRFAHIPLDFHLQG